MTTLWQRLTLTQFSAQQWEQASFLHRAVGLLRSWRKSSRLMHWADEIGLELAAILIIAAPFLTGLPVAKLFITGWMVLCGLYWILLTLSDDAETGSGTSPIHPLIWLYWWITTLASALSPVRAATLEGWAYLSVCVAWFHLLARVMRSPRLRSTLITLYLITALIVGVGGLRQWFFGAAALATWVDATSTLAGTTRVYSFLGNPNLLAGYLLPSIVLSAAAMLAWRGIIPKLLAGMIWVMNATCLVLTFSRGSWLGLTVAGIVFVSLLFMTYRKNLPRFWQTWGLPIALGSLATLMAIAILGIPPLRDRFFSIFAGRDDSSNNFRLNVWKAVISMIQDYPIFGIGPGNDAFNKLYPLYQEAKFTALSAYSILLEVPLETGIIGLGAFSWLLFVTLNYAGQQFKRLSELESREIFWLIGAIAALIGIFVQAIFDTVLYRPQVTTLWWWMFALIASFGLGAVPKNNPPSPVGWVEQSETQQPTDN
jgi:putative inorganic carbon (hco3(-)) transporter